jgi:hypothetical protein
MTDLIHKKFFKNCLIVIRNLYLKKKKKKYWDIKNSLILLKKKSKLNSIKNKLIHKLICQVENIS